MTELDPNDAGAHAELIRHTYVAVHLALAGFAQGLGPTLSTEDGAKILLSAAASLMAGHLGPQMTAITLRSLADAMSTAIPARELN